jgi:hypothetical protein
LGLPSAGSKDQFGRVSPPYAQNNGVVIYNSNAQQQLQLTDKAVKKILGEE